MPYSVSSEFHSEFTYLLLGIYNCIYRPVRLHPAVNVRVPLITYNQFIVYLFIFQFIKLVWRLGQCKYILFHFIVIHICTQCHIKSYFCVLYTKMYMFFFLLLILGLVVIKNLDKFKMVGQNIKYIYEKSLTTLHTKNCNTQN